MAMRTTGFRGALQAADYAGFDGYRLTVS